jgi:hypothetical protein
MGKKKCKEKGKEDPAEGKKGAKFQCKSCGSGARKENKLCKPKKI